LKDKAFNEENATFANTKVSIHLEGATRDIQPVEIEQRSISNDRNIVDAPHSCACTSDTYNRSKQYSIGTIMTMPTINDKESRTTFANTKVGNKMEGATRDIQPVGTDKKSISNECNIVNAPHSCVCTSDIYNRGSNENERAATGIYLLKDNNNEVLHDDKRNETDKRNEHDNEHAELAGKNLASSPVDHGNNALRTHHMAGSTTLDTECAIRASRDVICTKKNSKFSKPRRTRTNMENAMMSELRDNFCCDTGFKVGTECKDIISENGNLDVNPSTYPTGCPNNYFLLLNKTHTQS